MEKDFYVYLQTLKESGEILSIELQPKLELQEKFRRDGKVILPITYSPDFLVIYPDGRRVYFDSKGHSTQQGDLRRKMYLYRYPEELIWIAKSEKYAINGNPWVPYDYLMKCRRDAKKEAKSR